MSSSWRSSWGSSLESSTRSVPARAGGVRKVLFVGDSNVDNGSNSTEFVGRGVGIFSLFTLDGRFQPVKRLAAQSLHAYDDYDFGYSGWTCAKLENGDSGLYPVTYVGASDADLVIVHAGINDAVSAASAATVVASIVSLCQAVKATGKRVVGTTLIPIGGSAGSPYSTAIRDKVLQINTDLPGELAGVGVDCIDIAANIEVDGSSFAIANHVRAADGVHLMVEGAKQTSRAIADYLRSRGVKTEQVAVPVDGAAEWLTPNPYMAGTSGEHGMADGWLSEWENHSAAGVVTLNGNRWIQRTSNAGLGATDDVYRDASGWAAYAGRDVKVVCRMEMDAAGWDCKAEELLLEFYDSTPTLLLRNRQMYPGNSAYIGALTGTPFNGLIISPPITVPDATDNIRLQFAMLGDGTYRLRQMGVFDVTEWNTDALAYIAAVEAAGGTVTENQKTALHLFYEAGWMSDYGIGRFYLPIWNDDETNAIDLVTLDATGSFNGGYTKDAGWVKGNGTTGYFDFGVSYGDLGIGIAAAGQGILVYEADTQASSHVLFMGAYNGSSQGLAIRGTGGADQILILAYSYGGGGGYATATLSRANTLGIIDASRLSGKTRAVQRDGAGVSTLMEETDAETGSFPTANIVAMAGSSTPIQECNAKFGAYWAHAGLTESDAGDFSLAVKNLWERCTGLTLPTKT